MGSPSGTYAEKSPAGGRILIVDDQDDVRLMLQTVLSLDGWDTEGAASGEEAVARVGRAPDLDVLVVDYRMPDLDGVEVTRRIRSSGFERPIVICSAYLNPQIERDAGALGAHAVSKDDLGDLRETIRRGIGAAGPTLNEENSLGPHAIVESAEDAIIGQTLAGIVSSWNPAAERIFGYSAREMIGRPIWVLVPADHDNEVPEVLQKVRRGERVDHYEAARETKEHALIEVWLTVSPIRDAEGKIVGASTIVRDVTGRKTAERRARAVLETAHEAFVAADKDGMITDWNPHAERTLGWTRAEALGRPLAEVLISPHNPERDVQELARFLTAGEETIIGEPLELAALHKDGRELPVELTFTAINANGGRQFNVFIRDITERRQAEELQLALARERDAAEHLRDLNGLKDELLGTVSHELRTPLTVIAALAEVLGISPDHEDRASLLERIFQNASEMNAMIEQLLDYSRLEAGKVALEITSLPLRSAVLRCIELAPGKRQTSVEVPDELNVLADARGFERILVNLLANAAKFSPEDSPIQVTAWAENGVATIAVEDQGIGIPHEDQERVFERFHQLAASGTRGTGLGLSIVRRSVESLGGKVWVKSTPGQGSKFFFTLPLADRQGGSAR